jgi:hypothetical protein
MIGDVIPDWEVSLTKEEAETEFMGFKFNGPGWYVSQSGDCFYVSPDANLITHSPKDGRFMFSHYTEDPRKHFTKIANAPTVSDERMKDDRVL